MPHKTLLGAEYTEERIKKCVLSWFYGGVLDTRLVRMEKIKHVRKRGKLHRYKVIINGSREDVIRFIVERVGSEYKLFQYQDRD